MTDQDAGKGGTFSYIATLPLMIIYAMGFMSPVYMPVWVHAISEHYGVEISHIGLICSMELGAVAVTSILTAAFLDTRHLRWPVVVGLSLSIAANLFATVASSLELFAAARIIVGLANGFLLADINRRAADNPMPSRVFAGQIFVMAVFALLFFSNAPHLTATLGAGAAFFYCAAAGLLALVSLSGLPVSQRLAKRPVEQGVSSIGLAAILLLVAPTFIFITNHGIWAYLAPAAAKANVSLARLSTLLAMGALLNLGAPVISGWLAGRRVSSQLALTLGVCALALCVFFITGTGQTVLFSTGVLFMPFWLMFVVPFYLSALVNLDKSGRCVAASSAFFMIGSAIGPGAGGAVMDRMGLSGLALAGVVTALSALAITWVALTRAYRVRTLS